MVEEKQIRLSKVPKDDIYDSLHQPSRQRNYGWREIGRRFSAPLICICWKYKFFCCCCCSCCVVDCREWKLSPPKYTLRGSTLFFSLNRRTHTLNCPLLVFFFFFYSLGYFIFYGFPFVFRFFKKHKT